DNALIYEGPNQSGVTNIYKRPLAADKINQAGDEALFIGDRQLGVWYANGNRSLAVSAGEPADAPFRVIVTPNPVNDVARLNIESKTAATAQISVVNLLGSVVQNRSIQLSEGQNQFELNM